MNLIQASNQIESAKTIFELRGILSDLSDFRLSEDFDLLSNLDKELWCGLVVRRAEREREMRIAGYRKTGLWTCQDIHKSYL